MQSNNPVFRRSAEFNRGGGGAYAGYSDPSTWGTGQQGQGTAPGQGGFGAPGQAPQAPSRPAQPMTIDTVVQKTAITLGVVVVAAMATWILTPDLSNEAALAPLGAAIAVGSLGAFALSMVNSFKRVISPGLVLAYAALQGVALGAFSKMIDSLFGQGQSLVMQAVIGTFGAFAGTLAVYKFFNIKVGQKFRTFVMAAMFGMIGLALMELVLGLFGSAVGFFGFGGLGFVFAIVGLVLGVFMLIMDFDFVEQGIANGLPERESWRAAFAMAVSLVWVYTNLLRILAILNQD